MKSIRSLKSCGFITKFDPASDYIPTSSIKILLFAKNNTSSCWNYSIGCKNGEYLKMLANCLKSILRYVLKFYPTMFGIFGANLAY